MLSPMPKLSILFLGHPQPRDSGDWLHRVGWPGRALATKASVCAIQTTHPDWVKQALAADVLVVLMLADPILSEVIRQRRMAGRATVFEISDDFSAVAQANPLARYYGRPEVQALIRQLAENSDALQFSSRFLATKFSSLNSKSLVCLNQLHSLEPYLPRSRSNRLCIGWAGSQGHLEDARQLALWIGRWARHAEIQWNLMCSNEIASVFRETGISVSVRPTGSMEAYLNFLKELDVGLAWVGDDDFSRGRSDGKFLEYASCGVLPVCRNSPVYSETIVHGQTGFLFENELTLHSLLDRFLNNPGEVREIGKQAYEHVASQRTHEANGPERFNFYAGLTPFRSNDGAGYTEITSEIEADLYEGLQLANKGLRLEAFDKVLSVMERAPDFFFVWQVLETICIQLGKSEEARQCGRKKAALLYLDLPF